MIDPTTGISRVSLLRQRSKTFSANTNVPVYFSRCWTFRKAFFFYLSPACDLCLFSVSNKNISSSPNTTLRKCRYCWRSGDFSMKISSAKCKINVTPRFVRILVSSFEKPSAQNFPRCFIVSLFRRAKRNSHAKGIARYRQLKQLTEFAARSRVCYSFYQNKYHHRGLSWKRKNNNASVRNREDVRCVAIFNYSRFTLLIFIVFFASMTSDPIYYQHYCNSLVHTVNCNHQITWNMKSCFCQLQVFV